MCVCLNCNSGKVEDVHHFVGVCTELRQAREKMWSDIYTLLHDRMCLTLMALLTRQQVDWLLGTEPTLQAFKWPILQKVIVRGLETMMRERGRLF